jgi:hypothetical protein
MLFLSGVSALAVEKKDTKQTSRQKVEKKETTEQNRATQSETLKSHNQDQQKKENSDYFIDANNNGIDDRVENRKKKTEADKPENKEVKVKKAKPDSR